MQNLFYLYIGGLCVYKKILTVVLVVIFVISFSLTAQAFDPVDGFKEALTKNMELYPMWIGLDAQGLPTTMPTFTLRPASCIVERVWVEVPCDTDRDGKRDRISLYICRPRAAAGFKCPVVMEFSPYHNGTVTYPRVNNNDFNSSTDRHIIDMQSTFRYWPNYEIELQINPDTTNFTYNDIKYKGTEAWDPVWWFSQDAFSVKSWYTGIPYGSVPAATVPTGISAATVFTAWSPPARWDHYFVRGYAVAYGQLLGNKDSFGITNSLHVEEWLAAAAAAKWFNGEAKAFTTRTSSIEVIADWALGHVAMDGTSYPGTTPLVAAIAGVKGLKTIMTEANVTSWYEYYRSGGALHGPEGYGGEDMNLHASFNFSRFNADSSNGIPLASGAYFGLAAQQAFIQTQKYLIAGQDRLTADYNEHWDARNLTRGFGKIPDDMGILQTNGLQDWNVMPRHAYMMLQALRDKFGGYAADSYGTHKLVSGLSKHASQGNAGTPAKHRLVWGKDGVQRGMFKWYLMFLDHYLLGLDNQVDQLMYDVNIANNLTGEIEGFDYSIAKEERGTIIPGAHYQKLYLTPAIAEQAGRLSFTVPKSGQEHFDDLTMSQQIAFPMPMPVGATSRPASSIATKRSNQGNYTPSITQINYCDDRVIGINRTTNSYGRNRTLLDAVDKPVNGRLLYLSEPLTERMTLSGTPVAHLYMAPTKGTGNLSVALVEIGRKQRLAVRIEAVSLATTQAFQVFPMENGAEPVNATGYANPPHDLSIAASNFKYVTWGHSDAQNPSADGKAWFEVPEQNYTPNYYFQTTKLIPGKYYNYVVELNPYNYTFDIGMRIGVLIYGTDIIASPILDAASTGGFDIQLGEGSYIDLPVKYAELVK